ncbi:MAG: GAF domain-containing protein, partial [Oscillospiraceae bacterium]|nr:GAF domain-containing protein [Oscillospiraceae bacterium]
MSYYHHDKMLNALNEMDVMLFSQKDRIFEDVMSDALMPIAVTADVDRILFYSYNEDNRLGQVYRWDKAEGGTVSVDEELKTLPDIPVFKKWISISMNGDNVNINLETMTPDERAFLDVFGVKSLFFTPVFLNDELWGTVAFQNHKESRLFADDCVDFLTHAARLCANALIRYEKTEIAKKAIENLEHREKILDALNKAAITILSQDNENFVEIMTESLDYIAEPFNLDRISVWRNRENPDGLHVSQIYRWDKFSGGTTDPNTQLQNVAYKNIAPSWETLLASGTTFNGP